MYSFQIIFYIFNKGLSSVNFIEGNKPWQCQKVEHIWSITRKSYVIPGKDSCVQGLHKSDVFRFFFLLLKINSFLIQYIPITASPPSTPLRPSPSLPWTLFLSVSH